MFYDHLAIVADPSHKNRGPLSMQNELAICSAKCEAH